MPACGRGSSRLMRWFLSGDDHTDEFICRRKRRQRPPRLMGAELLEEALATTSAAGPPDLDVPLQLALISRHYERIGDQAVTIAGRAHYLAGA